MKTISLLKAVFSEDMKLFKVSYKKNSKISKIILAFSLCALYNNATAALHVSVSNVQGCFS